MSDTFLSKFLARSQVPPSKKVKTSFVPSERVECVEFVTWLQSQGIRHTHVANETRSRVQAISNKQLGTSKGFPDYIVYVSGKVVHIEMKRTKGGKLSPEQKEWLAFLQREGHPAACCNGFDDAKKFVEKHR